MTAPMSFRRKKVLQNTKMKNIYSLSSPTPIGDPGVFQVFTHLDSRLRGSDEQFCNSLFRRNDEG